MWLLFLALPLLLFFRPLEDCARVEIEHVAVQKRQAVLVADYLVEEVVF